MDRLRLKPHRCDTRLPMWLNLKQSLFKRAKTRLNLNPLVSPKPMR